MVATAENTQMKQWRSTLADYTAVNPVPGDGEFVWTSDVKVLKIGDGVTAYNSLPKLYDATINTSDLSSAVAAAQESALAADEAAQNASQSNAATVGYAQSASDSLAAAIVNQQLARDYAVGGPGTVLPTGGDSAAVSAQKASDIAIETRHIRMPPADILTNRTLASGDLFREHDCNNTGLLTLTIPAGLFTSIERKKAWAVFRQRGIGGSIKVQAATGGSDLVAPQIVKSQVFGWRSQVVTVAGSVVPPGPPPIPTAFVLGNIPAVTSGKLVIIGVALWNNSTASNTMTITSDSGLTWTTRRAQGDAPLPVSLVPSWSVYEAPLTAYAGGDVAVVLHPSAQGNYHGGFWFVLEGTTAVAPTIAVTNATAVASTVSTTLTALAASSQVLAVSAQRGISTTVAHTSFSTNIVRIGSSNTALGGSQTSNIDSVSDTNGTKNLVFGRGNGVPSVTGNFTVQADYSFANDEPTIILVAYPPKTVIGGGTVNLELEGGRDTMAIQHGEMMLKFMPDGTTVQVQTSH